MKNKSNYRVIGLMSGTSLDGLDLAYCEFTKKDKWSYKCFASQTVKYPEEILSELRKATSVSKDSLSMLDIKLGHWYGVEVNRLIAKNNLKVDFLASHGHTIFHQPKEKKTLQIGSGKEIRNVTGLMVVNDFRSLDVALGGEGAPLVPIGDELLFSAYDYCINLGGIANISFREDGKRVAFDIGACNMVFNRLANRLGFEYDEQGSLAASGTKNKTLLKVLNQWGYYEQSGPKSLGYEQVSAQIFPLVDDKQYKTKDVLATYASHLGSQIGRVISPLSKVLITGGGAYNTHLIKQIKQHLPNGVEITIPEDQIIDFKEAIVFAFLGVLKVRGEINCLSSVTGATRDSSGGVIHE